MIRRNASPWRNIFPKMVSTSFAVCETPLFLCNLEGYTRKGHSGSLLSDVVPECPSPSLPASKQRRLIDLAHTTICALSIYRYPMQYHIAFEKIRTFLESDTFKFLHLVSTCWLRTTNLTWFLRHRWPNLAACWVCSFSDFLPTALIFFSKYIVSASLLRPSISVFPFWPSWLILSNINRKLRSYSQHPLRWRNSLPIVITGSVFNISGLQVKQTCSYSHLFSYCMPHIHPTYEFTLSLHFFNPSSIFASPTLYIPYVPSYISPNYCSIPFLPNILTCGILWKSCTYDSCIMTCRKLFAALHAIKILPKTSKSAACHHVHPFTLLPYGELYHYISVFLWASSITKTKQHVTNSHEIIHLLLGRLLPSDRACVWAFSGRHPVRGSFSFLFLLNWTDVR